VCPADAVGGGTACTAPVRPWRCAALASSCRTVRPSDPGTRVGSRFSLSFPYQTPSFFSFGAPLLARLLANRTPSPPFFFFPTQARTGSAPWPMPSPPCDLSLVISLYAASTPAHCTTTSVHQAFIMPPCLPLLHSTPRSEVELVESIPSVRAWVGEAREAVRKKVVGGRAT
jgi:hypothetical protein